MKKYPKKFRIKAKGTYVGSPKRYVYVKRNGKVIEFFRKLDAHSYLKKIRKQLRARNRMLSLTKRDTFKARIVKVK